MLPTRISAAERRTILLGISVSVAALAVAYLVVPLARRWQVREEVITARTERLERLRGLVASEERLRAAVAEREAALAAAPTRLLTGRTPALAASSLQSRIQEYADQSRVTVSRLDVAGAPITGEGSLPMIPAEVAALGDLYGVVDLLSRLEGGPVQLDIRELVVRPNPALRGELIQMTLSLRGAYRGG